MKNALLFVTTILLSFTVYAQTPPPPEKQYSDTTKEISQDRIFVKVDQTATFKGGNISTFRDWVIKELVYPKLSLTNKEEGSCYISFIVNTNGDVEDINILKSSNFKNLDDEAIRVIASSPKWTPAKHGGEIVKQQFVIPINFQFSR